MGLGDRNTKRKKIISVHKIFLLFSSGLYRRSRNFTPSGALTKICSSQTHRMQPPVHCRYGISPIPKELYTVGNFG